MKFIMFLRFIISSSSWLVFIRHMPFSLFGLNIYLKIFLSNTNSLCHPGTVFIFTAHEGTTFYPIDIISPAFQVLALPPSQQQKTSTRNINFLSYSNATSDTASS